MKKLLVFTLFSFISSCNSIQDKYFTTLKGEWQIVKFYHNNNDLLFEDSYILGFENRNNLFIIRTKNKEDHFINSKYKIYKDSIKLKMDIINCEDVSLNSDYILHIDTIQNNDEDYILRLVLDSKDNYIEAIRSKLKFNDYNEFLKK